MKALSYLYTYVRHVDEHDLCKMEMRAFFGCDVDDNVLVSELEVDPHRSPFMKERLSILIEADSFDELVEQAASFEVSETFRTISLNTEALGSTEKIGHSKRREIERTIGLAIHGEPDLDNPERLLGIAKLGNKWLFGDLVISAADWHAHQQKPHMYSTALSTRLARAVANIAVPRPEGVRAIDPCCGIGTVLVEALSMGIDIDGRDKNPLVVYGSRKNIRHFGLDGSVEIGPIAEVEASYDVAIIDMPYNLFTHITDEDQFAILQDARRIAKKCLIITIEPIDEMIRQAGFQIVDRCLARKGTFTRDVVLCE